MGVIGTLIGTEAVCEDQIWPDSAVGISIVGASGNILRHSLGPNFPSRDPGRLKAASGQLAAPRGSALISSNLYPCFLPGLQAMEKHKEVGLF